MYYYIVNPHVGNGKINKIQEELKQTLTSFGVGGDFSKITGTGDAEKLANHAIEGGYKTIIIVGGDELIGEVAAAILKSNEKIALGIIPIGEENQVSRVLGISDWREACEIVAHRRLETIDIGLVESENFSKHFLVGVNVNYFPTKNKKENIIKKTFLNLPKSYLKRKKFVLENAKIVLNDNIEFFGNVFSLECFNLFGEDDNFFKISPKDKKLDLILNSKTDSLSNNFKKVAKDFSKFKVDSISASFIKPTKIKIDNVISELENFKISIIPDGISVIVGKDRKI